MLQYWNFSLQFEPMAALEILLAFVIVMTILVHQLLLGLCNPKKQRASTKSTSVQTDFVSELQPSQARQSQPCPSTCWLPEEVVVSSRDGKCYHKAACHHVRSKLVKAYRPCKDCIGWSRPCLLPSACRCFLTGIWAWWSDSSVFFCHQRIKKNQNVLMHIWYTRDNAQHVWMQSIWPRCCKLAPKRSFSMEDRQLKQEILVLGSIVINVFLAVVLMLILCGKFQCPKKVRKKNHKVLKKRSHWLKT